MKFRIKLTAGVVTQWFQGWTSALNLVTTLDRNKAWTNDDLPTREMARKVKQHLNAEDDWATVVQVEPLERVKVKDDAFEPMFSEEELARFEKEVEGMTVAEIEEAQEAVKLVGEQIDKVKSLLFRALPKKIAQEKGKDTDKGLPVIPKKRKRCNCVGPSHQEGCPHYKLPY